MCTPNTRSPKRCGTCYGGDQVGPGRRIRRSTHGGTKKGRVFYSEIFRIVLGDVVSIVIFVVVVCSKTVFFPFHDDDVILYVWYWQIPKVVKKIGRVLLLCRLSRRCEKGSKTAVTHLVRTITGDVIFVCGDQQQSRRLLGESPTTQLHQHREVGVICFLSRVIIIPTWSSLFAVGLFRLPPWVCGV